MAEAYVRARDADPLSAFGGIVGLNRALDAETAPAMTSTFIEAVIAPSVADEAQDDPRGESQPARGDRELRCACELCRRRRRLRSGRRHPHRSWAACSPRSAIRYWKRAIPGLQLHAESATSLPRPAIRVVTKRQPTPEEWDGAAVRVARVRAREVEHGDLHRRGSHAGGRRRSDEPRRCGEGRGAEGGAGIADGDRSWRRTPSSRSATVSTRVADAGATAVVQPGGSVRDAEVIAAADERGLAMVFTGRRHFRH